MRELPLFPLNTVLFPGMPLHLHIFEPRYRLMVRTCMQQDIPFGVVLIRQGKEALGPLANPHLVGCTARIMQMDPLPDGRMNLLTVGEERFHVMELNFDSQPYLTGQVETHPLENPRGLEVMRGTRTLARLAVNYLRLLSKIDEESSQAGEVKLPEDPLPLLNLAAGVLQLPEVEKQPLLESLTASQMLAQLLRLYKRETAVLSRMTLVNEEQARRASWMN